MGKMRPPIDPHGELLQSLTRHVRLLTLDQVARTWWSHTARPKSNAKKKLNQLQKQGLVHCFTILARPEIKLSAPVFVWTPGDPAPSFGPIAYRLQSRWKGPLVPTEVVIATKQAKRECGGYIGGRKPRDSEATHDVHLAQVYLRLRKTQPELLAGWVSEAQQYAEGGGKNARLPDAIIRSEGSPRLLIEFAGAYSKQKLQAFHGESQQASYQLW